MIGDLKDTLRKADGTYDEKRGNILDILALEIQMYSEMRQNKKLKVSQIGIIPKLISQFLRKFMQKQPQS